MVGGIAGQARLPPVDAPAIDHPFQIIATGMVAPLALVFSFNMAAALITVLLGYPRLALGAFIACCAVDVVFQRQVAHWLRAYSPAQSETAALNKLAAACLARNSLLSVPATVMALSGGSVQIAYLGIAGSTGVLLAFANGTLSPRIFWAYAFPPLVAFTLCTLVDFQIGQAAALLISLLILALLLAGVSHKTTRLVQAWQAAFSESRVLIAHLQQARDLAIEAKNAADQAREEAREASKAKSNFLANMSHELRTPMNAILGFSEIIKDEVMGPNGSQLYRSYAADIHASGAHLLNLINSILDLSKIEAGKLELNETRVDLYDIVEGAARLIWLRAREKGVQLVNDLPPGAVIVFADASALRQVALNVAANAVKFTPPGGSVRVSLLAEDRRFGVLIRDTGCGIKPEDIEKIFESFGQGTHQVANAEQGTGLGLPIARGLMRAHAGDLSVSSIVGEGSMFLVTLPAERVLNWPGEGNREAVA